MAKFWKEYFGESAKINLGEKSLAKMIHNFKYTTYVTGPAKIGHFCTQNLV